MPLNLKRLSANCHCSKPPVYDGMNIPKTHNNATVQSFVGDYYRASELRDGFPQIDDIFCGVLELKTAGNSSTRSLSRQVLFHILQWCPVLDVESINRATNQQYAYSTLASYTAVARVASKAIARFLEAHPKTRRETTVRQEQQALDAPYLAELEALGLTEQFKFLT